MPFRPSVPRIVGLSNKAREGGSGPASGAEAGAEILDPVKSVEALLCFEQSWCVRLPFIGAYTTPANLRLMANDFESPINFINKKRHHSKASKDSPA